jgi:hypothetical protein
MNPLIKEIKINDFVCVLGKNFSIYSFIEIYDPIPGFEQKEKTFVIKFDLRGERGFEKKSYVHFHPKEIKTITKPFNDVCQAKYIIELK